MRRWTYVMGTALVVGTLATSAWVSGGQPYPTCASKPSAADQEAAKSLFKAGEVAFSEANYQKAIQYWRDAYERDCTAHLLLKNLSRAYELAGDKREAVLALKTYLDRVPNAQDKDSTKRRIENLEATQPASSGTGAVVPVPTSTTGAPAPTSTDQPAPTATGTDQPPPSGGGKSIAPWIVVGVGGVTTIIGGVVWLSGNSKYNDADAACPSHKNCPQSVTEDSKSGKDTRNLGGAVFLVGLGVTAAGLVWEFAFNKPKSDTHAKTRLIPVASPQFSGLTFNGSF